jgi:hypothetical protein
MTPTDRLAAMSMDSLATTKRLLRASVTANLSDHLDEEADNIAHLSASPDGVEGVRAFAAKRRPTVPISMRACRLQRQSPAHSSPMEPTTASVEGSSHTAWSSTSRGSRIRWPAIGHCTNS